MHGASEFYTAISTLLLKSCVECRRPEAHKLFVIGYNDTSIADADK
jgi:hypothetical protein